MFTTHTPGPWRHSAMRYCTITAGNGRENRVVAEIPCKSQHPATEDTACANARLIAAAPETIAALADCVELLEFIHDNMPKHHCTVGCPDMGKRVRRGLTAIAKATPHTFTPPH